MNAELEGSEHKVPSAVIVLAAGAGTRMKSATPKVMHSIGGRSMVEHAVAAARDLTPERLAVVVRHQRDKVAEHVLAFDEHRARHLRGRALAAARNPPRTHPIP